MSVPRSAAIAAAASLLLAGCATLPRERGYAETAALLQQRIGVSPDASTWAAADAVELPSGSISLPQAIAASFVHAPRMREQYARIGLARAEVEQARRLTNPGFSFSRRHGGGEHPAITRSLSLGFTDLLLQPARRRFAADELDRMQQQVASDLLGLATDVEIAWYDAVAAGQVAAMRALVARASEASATLAQRYFDAGNISRLQLEQERAQATQARIALAHANVERFRTRNALAELAGLAAAADWSLPERLPAPSGRIVEAVSLVPLAHENRLDLQAAQRALAQHDSVLALARRWRWLGAVELGFEREREADGGVMQGPELSLQLPVFDQGQAAVARAEAERTQAQAQLDALTLSVGNETRLAVQRVNVAREIVEHYRTALLPAREAIVARMQERVNYMLVGVFELIRARNDEFDAYQAYLEAVRDYWTARAQLRRSVGGRLPDDEDQTSAPTLGIDAVLPTPSEVEGSDPHHGHHSPAPQAPSPQPVQHPHEHDHGAAR